MTTPKTYTFKNLGKHQIVATCNKSGFSLRIKPGQTIEVAERFVQLVARKGAVLVDNGGASGIDTSAPISTGNAHLADNPEFQQAMDEAVEETPAVAKVSDEPSAMDKAIAEAEANAKVLTPAQKAAQTRARKKAMKEAGKA